MGKATPPRWRALVVDDERIARLSLRSLLEAIPGVEVVGEAASAREALDAFREKTPNILFVDVQMPVTDGFALVEQLDGTIPVVFVTASDRYAVRAFEVNALDYLVKPVAPARLRRTLSRLDRQTPSPRPAPPSKPASGGDVLFLPLEQSRIFVPLDRVVTIGSRRNNSVVRLDDGRIFIVRRSLRQWGGFLDPRLFARINRHTLLHLKFIRSFTPQPTGTAVVVLEGSSQTETVSRRLAVPLKRVLDTYRGG
jgi:two-component system, LytTR family, response regulator